MGVATAIAAVGAATAVYGAVKSNAAGKDAANAQGQIAQEQLAQAQKAAAYAAPTSDELQTLGNQVKLYDSAYTQSAAQLSTLQKQITDTYGANIIEQGQQLHQELLGQNSVIVQQAQDNAQRQRQSYQQQLISKLGPGALSSSAGIQAMNSFDRSTAQSIAGLQEQSINQAVSRLGGLQSDQSSAVQSVLGINNSLSSMLQGIQSVQNNFQVRQANAQMGVTQYEGADQVQNLQLAKNSAALGNNISQIGGQVMGAGLSSALTNKSGSPKPTTPDGGSPSLASNTFDANTNGRNFNLGSVYSGPSENSDSWASSPLGGGQIQGSEMNFQMPTQSTPRAPAYASYFNKNNYAGSN